VVRFGGRSFVFSFADVDLNDLEVFHIGDQPIIILIDTLEDILANVIGESNVKEFIGTVNQSGKLLKGHFSFRSS